MIEFTFLMREMEEGSLSSATWKTTSMRPAPSKDHHPISTNLASAPPSVSSIPVQSLTPRQLLEQRVEELQRRVDDARSLSNLWQLKCQRTATKHAQLLQEIKNEKQIVQFYLQEIDSLREAIEQAKLKQVQEEEMRKSLTDILQQLADQRQQLQNQVDESISKQNQKRDAVEEKVKKLHEMIEKEHKIRAEANDAKVRVSAALKDCNWKVEREISARTACQMKMEKAIEAFQRTFPSSSSSSSSSSSNLKSKSDSQLPTLEPANQASLGS